MHRLSLFALAAFAASALAPTAAACSIICQNQPRNASERAAQVRTAIKRYDYIFVGTVVAIGEPETVRVLPTMTVEFTPVTIRPTKILKGEPTELITVRLVLDDGGNCGVRAVIGEYFEGLVTREPEGLMTRGVGCDDWAIFAEDGPLPAPHRPAQASCQ